jgi:large subunit ribosomal protein L30
MAKTFEVKLIKSTIGCSQDQIKTVRALGLKKTNQVVSVNDNPANRGQLYKVQHLVEVNIKK